MRTDVWVQSIKLYTFVAIKDTHNKSSYWFENIHAVFLQVWHNFLWNILFLRHYVVFPATHVSYGPLCCRKMFFFLLLFKSILHFSHSSGFVSKTVFTALLISFCPLIPLLILLNVLCFHLLITEQPGKVPTVKCPCCIFLILMKLTNGAPQEFL